MKTVKVVAIVQARMSSRRLPGKVLADLGGHPVLSWVTGGLRPASTLDEIVVATSTDQADDAIAKWCAEAEFRCYRGSLKDVLARYASATRWTQADVVVRITADCPLIDPQVVDLVVHKINSENLDYCGLGGEFPHGLDCEAMTAEALERAHSEAVSSYDREHVTPYLKRSGLGFRTGSVEPFKGLSHHRWTLDHPQDLAFLRAVVAYRREELSRLQTTDVLAILDSHPELSDINAGFNRNERYKRPLE